MGGWVHVVWWEHSEAFMYNLVLGGAQWLLVIVMWGCVPYSRVLRCVGGGGGGGRLCTMAIISLSIVIATVSA